MDPAERPTFMEIMEWLSELEDLPSDIEESPQLLKARQVKKSSMNGMVGTDSPKGRAASSSQPPGIAIIDDADRIWYHQDEEDDTVMGPFARTEMLEWVRLFCIFDRESSHPHTHNIIQIRSGRLNKSIKCGVKPTGPFFEISTLGDHVFDDVWKVASGVKYWWYKTKKKKGYKLYGPFSSEKMKKWLSKSKIPWNLQISPASSKTQTQPKDLDAMYFFPLLSFGASPFSSKMSSPVGKIRSIDRPSALQVMRDKEKNRKLNKDDKAYVRKCPHDHLLVYRQSCIVVKGTTRLTQKIRCSTCGALQMRRAKVYACELCKWYLCTDCDRISMGSNNTDDRDESKTQTDDDVSRKRAHTQDRRSRTRSTLISLDVTFEFFFNRNTHAIFS